MQIVKSKIFLLTGAAAIMLSACSTSSSNDSATVAPTPAPQMTAFQTLGADSNAIANRVSGLPGSRFDAVPTSGTARFAGTGEIEMTLDAGAQFRGIGDANVTVGFAPEATPSADTVLGGITNIAGAIGTEAQVNAGNGRMVDVDGEIALGKLNVYGGDEIDERINTFGVSYAGTLGVDGVDYVIDGRAEQGQFKGTYGANRSGNRLRAIQIEDTEAEFATVGTQTVAGGIKIYGEQP